MTLDGDDDSWYNEEDDYDPGWDEDVQEFRPPGMELCEVCHLPLWWNGKPTHNCVFPEKKWGFFERLFNMSLEPYCMLCGHLHSAHVKWPDDVAEREAWRRLMTLVAVDFISGAGPLF